MSEDAPTEPFVRAELWLVRTGSAAPIGPVSTELLIRGIRAKKVPPDAWVKRDSDTGWNLWRELPQFHRALIDDPNQQRPEDALPVDAPAPLSSERVRIPSVPSMPAAPVAPASLPPAPPTRPMFPVDAVPSSQDLAELLMTPAPLRTASVLTPLPGSAASLLASSPAPPPVYLPKASTEVFVRPSLTGTPANAEPVRVSAPMTRLEPSAPSMRRTATLPPTMPARSPWPSVVREGDFDNAGIGTGPMRGQASTESTLEAPTHSRWLPILIVLVAAAIGAIATVMLLKHL
jgi:hypothetical protein